MPLVHALRVEVWIYLRATTQKEQNNYGEGGGARASGLGAGPLSFFAIVWRAQHMQQDDPTLPWDLGAYLKTSKRARHGQKRHSKTRKQGCCPPHKQRSCTDLAATFAPGPQTLILPHEISEATGPCRASLLLLVCLCWAWCFFGGVLCGVVFG